MRPSRAYAARVARLDIPAGPGGDAAMLWTLRPELAGGIGAGCATYGLWLSPDEATRRGLLEQSYFAVGGFLLIALGTVGELTARYGVETLEGAFFAATGRALGDEEEKED